MTHIKHTLLLIAMLAIALTTQAKQEDIFVFGIATSFNDSIVCITDIQELKQAYITDTREKFLQERDNYSYQLRDHLAAKGLANRTVATFWATSRKDIEKKYNSVLSKYIPSQKKKKKSKAAPVYELRYLTAGEFTYTVVTPDEGPVYVDAKEAEEAARKSKVKEKKGMPSGGPQGTPPSGGQPPVGGMGPR